MPIIILAILQTANASSFLSVSIAQGTASKLASVATAIGSQGYPAKQTISVQIPPDVYGIYVGTQNNLIGHEITFIVKTSSGLSYVTAYTPINVSGYLEQLTQPGTYLINVSAISSCTTAPSQPCVYITALSLVPVTTVVTTTSVPTTTSTIPIMTYPWATTNSLVTAQMGLSCITLNNYVYCMGGGGTSPMTGVQYASILGGGAGISTWHTTNTLAADMDYESCVTANNYIYCMGGGSTWTQVQYASILSGGVISTWTSQSNTLIQGEYASSCVTAHNYIYCMGGGNNGYYNQVQYASIPPSGGPTSTWTYQSNTLAFQANGGLSCITENNYIYCMGSGTAEPYNRVQYASIPAGGGPTSQWSIQANSLAADDYGESCVVTTNTNGNYIYCMGGGLTANWNQVEYASIPSGGGPTGQWFSQTTNTLAAYIYYPSCVTVNNYAYCMGGNDQSWYAQSVVQYTLS